MPLDALPLAQKLIRCPSITPVEGGALAALEDMLTPLGFTCHRLVCEDGDAPVENLYARRGTCAPHFCFAGHTDVVPPGDENAWRHPPFAAEVHDGVLFGRGAEDLKGAIAAMVVATARFLEQNPEFAGSISFLIAGDEEGGGLGTPHVLRWLTKRGETLDACLVGEPTNPSFLGEMIKIGRRGSMSSKLTVHGTQGHIAYPHLAENPITQLVNTLHALKAHTLDEGTDHFLPSNLEVTSVDVGNATENLIPASASAAFNIRFNDRHDGESLKEWVESVCRDHCNRYELNVRISAAPFLTPPGRLSDVVSSVVSEVTGRTPELSTTGGTSDARFIKDACPVVEFGTTGKTAHQVDECVDVAVLEQLSAVYASILHRFFADAAS